MKKLYLVMFAALLLGTYSASAQRGLYLGLALTEQSTWITNQNNYGLPEMDYKPTWGMGYNLNIGYDLTKHIGVKVEFGSAKFGQEYTDNLGDSALSRKLSMTHFQIPVLIKYRIGGPVAKFYIAAGPQFDFITKATQTYTINGQPFSAMLVNKGNETFDIGSEDIKDRFVSSEVFVRMDLGVDVTIIKHLVLNAGIKFGYGLTDLNSANYQIPDHSGTYHASHELFGGATIGANWHF